MSERTPTTDEETAGTTPWRSAPEVPDEDRPAMETRSTGDPAAFRAAYGPIRGPLKRRAERFSSLRTWLAQAQFGQTPDEYLADAVRRSLVVTAATVALFVALLGVVVPRVEALAPLTRFAEPSPLVLGSGVVLTVGTLLVWLLAHYYYPLVWAAWRRRHIDTELPHAVVFMYVLSQAGLDLQEILRRVADSEETYGEVAAEFRGIALEMDRFGLDTLTALDEAKKRTPSTNLAEFLDDVENVIESGGHLDSFLESRSETQLQEARQRQENRIETVATIVEGYMTLVFAGPIFLITILIILGFVGIDTLLFVNLTTYGLIPLGIVGFLVFFHLFNRPYERTLTIEMDEPETGATTDGEQIRAYRRANRVGSFRAFLSRPVASMEQRPLLSLLFTAPVAALVLLAVLATEVATPADYGSQPIWTTTMLVVVPLLVPSVGLMLANESERRRQLGVKRRLPELLRGLASSHRNGLLLHNAVSLAARRSEGALAAHVRRLDNDIRLTGDIHRSLREFAAEVGVNRVTRVVRIIMEGHRTSGDLEDVLRLTSEDTQERHRLDVQWRHGMQPYVVFFVIGVLVYVFIILVFFEVFFPILTDVGGEIPSEIITFGAGEVSLPITAYESTLYHSLLIQAFGNGLVMGKLIENSLVSGLKYANPLLVVVVAVFYVV